MRDWSRMLRNTLILNVHNFFWRRLAHFLTLLYELFTIDVSGFQKGVGVTRLGRHLDVKIGITWELMGPSIHSLFILEDTFFRTDRKSVV